MKLAAKVLNMLELRLDEKLSAEKIAKRMQADLLADSVKIEDSKRGKSFKLFYKKGKDHLLDLNKKAIKWSRSNTVIGKGHYITSVGNDAEITMLYRKEVFE